MAELLSGSNCDFSVVGALGPQGCGKSAFLNALLGFGGPLPGAGPHPCTAFPTAAAAAVAAGQHCTRGLGLRVGTSRMIGLDAQPLFSASVLERMASVWADQPPPALAAPAAAAASDAKAPAVPYEGVQALAQLQLAVLVSRCCPPRSLHCGPATTHGRNETPMCWRRRAALPSCVPLAVQQSEAATAEPLLSRLRPANRLQLLSVCNRLLVFADGLEDRRTWEFLATAEMLARGESEPLRKGRSSRRQGWCKGCPASAPMHPLAQRTGWRCLTCIAAPLHCTPAGIPDPSLPPREQPPAAAAQQAQQRQAPPQEHLAEVVLVHVLPAGQGPPTAAQLQALQQRLDAYFAGSRLCHPGESVGDGAKQLASNGEGASPYKSGMHTCSGC